MGSILIRIQAMNFQDRAIAEIKSYFPNVEVINRIQESGGFGLADLKPEGYEYIERSSMGNGETAEDDAIYRLWSLKHYKDPDHITVSAAFSVKFHDQSQALIEFKLWYKS